MRAGEDDLARRTYQGEVVWTGGLTSCQRGQLLCVAGYGTSPSLSPEYWLFGDNLETMLKELKPFNRKDSDENKGCVSMSPPCSAQAKPRAAAEAKDW
jgi:hypothetical protein